MRSFELIAALTLLIAACGSRDEAPPQPQQQPQPPAAANGPASAAPAPASEPQAGGGWDLQSSGEGTALALVSASGATTVRLFCPAGEDRLIVNVPGFRAIGSEERLSFGSGGRAEALVADSRGDAQRGGVSGGGGVPADLAGLLAGPLSVSYGAQTSGPHSAPRPALARAFVAACRGGATATPPTIPPQAASAGPCLMQGRERLQVAPLRAVGTEPFWGARIEGRCVTYSHPEDQQGTRVWTRYAPAPDGGGTWSGALGGQRFELRVRRQAGCSDGMSDERYPFAVDLAVGGEQRHGCAKPL